MPILNILEKLIFKKSNFYNITNSSFFCKNLIQLQRNIRLNVKILLRIQI